MFKVGDVVVCVNSDRAPMLKLQATYRVSGVNNWGICELDGAVYSGVLLFGVNINGYDAIDARRFKHLPKADDTFINQMRSLKPAKEMTNVR
jgi:hypothetical protein